MIEDKRPDRKLKRGLEDISPLFKSIPHSNSPVIHPPSVSYQENLYDVQFLTVCVPDHEGDAFLANAYLASQIVRHANFYASLVSIVPGFNTRPSSRSLEALPSLELLDPHISRLVLSHQELWNFTQNGSQAFHREDLNTPPTNQNPFLLFLEFEPTHFRSLARIALLLDRVVLFVQPLVESLKEAYRMIKIFSSHNREIEFTLLFRGRAASKSLEEFLFEQFSLITSRFLGISAVWLGNLDFPDKKSTYEQQMGIAEYDLAPVLAAEGLKRPLSPEKSHLWAELRKIVEKQLPHGSHQ
ncbi:MAG: hypothetical protein HY447_04955 [Candidatus Omnitrophica bacterium]|nr:hypothetical protein [Candidatus Omnitrophota bacterium]